MFNRSQHIVDRTKTTAALRVKRAATCVIARRRLKPSGPDVLHVKELFGTNPIDNTENRMNYLFGNNKSERTFSNGWELLLGQSECQNYLRSTPTSTSIMRYPGEYKFAGGAVDTNESLEAAARRELEEEFLCVVPQEAKLRLFDIKQTRPVQNTSYIMHNFLILESENPWLTDAFNEVNVKLEEKRNTFNRSKEQGEFWKMNKAEKEKYSPEVHQISWLDMKTAVKHSFLSMNYETQYVNDFQQSEFERLNIQHRDPLFITMVSV